jgi:hypothetical protein
MVLNIGKVQAHYSHSMLTKAAVTGETEDLGTSKSISL